MLAEALIEFEDTAHCPNCHQLKSKAWDKTSTGAWEVVTDVTCYACAANEQQSKPLPDPEPGELRFLAFNEEDHKRAKKRAERIAATE
ncbi:hypothetical protein [Brevibacterium zhoupengii]|uniref:hypothetical protein n=1 Tax=Brevibacterium zhoupengii TaxID=2898795 RepID=UPI001F097FF8|nr:hypothetical protein [Brevibacterium zhoupengii]